MGRFHPDLPRKGDINMLKKTLAVIGVAALTGAGAMDVLPQASAESLNQYDGVQLAQCNPCAAAKKACNPCNPCAVKKVCNPCNPCAAKKANPCGT
jgi:hypothetical protein